MVFIATISTHRCCGVSYKYKVCGNPVSSQSVGAIFSNSICSLHVSGSILVILKTFQALALLMYLLWCCVFSDVVVTIVIVGGTADRAHGRQQI